MTSKLFTVLAAIGWPGDEATGPVQSLIRLGDALAGEFRFKVLARERPFGQRSSRIKPENWVKHGPLEILWCRMAPFGPSGFSSILRATPHDVLMLNGFFDPEFTIPALMLRRLGRIPRRPTILMPRGEFSSGALSLKSGRKQTYLALARRLGLHRDVWLQATGPREAQDIRQVYPFSRGVFIAPNVRDLGPAPAPRVAGAPPLPLRLVFLGRIARVKNLDIALKVLSLVRSSIVFDIFGPIQEADYWRECQQIIAGLPANVSVTHRGEISNASVPSRLADYDLFFLPTRGENFGHAIMDALTASLPVLISDRTPFQNLEREGAGWSLPLGEPSRFAEAIEAIAAMSEGERRRRGAAARCLAERIIEENDAVALNRKMLAAVLAAETP